jgi:probable F420-dependent oxidoreductase
MKFAFNLPHLMELSAMTQQWELAVTGADQTRMAKRAEELGYDMVAIPEHFLMPRAHIELSGSHWLHSITTQAYLAGATERIRLASCVTLLPLQHPVITAKALATADWLSSGRITATFGVGWLRDEFDLLGVPFEKRGRMCDEYLAAIIELWTSDAPSFDGQFVSFHDVAFDPKPVQKPHLPIWIGGDADAALRRAARFATGWIPFLTAPQDIAARIDFIKSDPNYDGRDFEIVYGVGTSLIGEGHVAHDDPTTRADMSADAIIDELGRLREAGVTMSAVLIPRVRDVDEYLDYAQWVIEDIKPKVP